MQQFTMQIDKTILGEFKDRLEVMFLAPYSTKLNLIEEVWC